MATLKADRRLYETANRDALVEEGDPRGRWLLAGLTRTIGEADVKKYGLSSRDGRVVYEGCPTEFGELAPQVKEARAHADKMVRDHKDKAEAEREPADDPVMRIGHDEKLEEWTQRMAPEAYLKRYPTGPNAELAQRHVDAAKADGGSGDS